MPVYTVHDNGGRPFQVSVNGKKVRVKQTQTGMICLEATAEKVFIGKSPLNAMTEFSGGYGPKFDGNTILLKFTNNRYVFIGQCVMAFETRHDIVKYVSHVGNNDVPYPYAIDEQGNILLLTENVILCDRPYPDEVIDDPYTFYYKKSLITPDLSMVRRRQDPRKSQDFEYYENITKFYIDRHQYTFQFHPQPATYYRDVMKRLKGKQMFIVQNNKKAALDHVAYVRLMKRFAKTRVLRLLRTKTFIQRDTACNAGQVILLHEFIA